MPITTATQNARLSQTMKDSLTQQKSQEDIQETGGKIKKTDKTDT